MRGQCQFQCKSTDVREAILDKRYFKKCYTNIQFRTEFLNGYIFNKPFLNSFVRRNYFLFILWISSPFELLFDLLV